uniref:Uncharacterized protein n=1 Tax=Magallana gigas TaxID=29159 RepID=K1Q7C7_MAGGI
MAVSSSEPEKQDEIKELKGMIQQLTTKVSAIEQGSTYKKFEQQPTSWDYKDQQQQSLRETTNPEIHMEVKTVVQDTIREITANMSMAMAIEI